MAMLPKLGRLNPCGLVRGSGVPLVCSLAIISLPTWMPQAQSQEVPRVLSAAPVKRDTASVSPTIPAPSIEFFPQPTAAEQKILTALDRDIQFEFVDQSLDGLLTYLAENHELRALVDTSKLEEESIVSDAADLTLKIRGVSLRTGLKLLLKQKQMTFAIEDEVLKLTTQTEAAKLKPITRFYPARDLLGLGEADEQQLIGIIQSSTDDARRGILWIDLDGEGGSISVSRQLGCLVVQATRDAHDELLKVVRAMRQAKSHPSAR